MKSAENGRPPLILVVESDPLLRDFYAKVLANQGYTAVCAENTPDAVELLDSETYLFALAVVDFLQTGDQHIGVLDHIKESSRYSQLPVIAIIELSPTNQELDRIYAACESVIGRGDFELPRFYSMIDNLLRRSQLRDDDDTTPLTRDGLDTEIEDGIDDVKRKATTRLRHAVKGEKAPSDDAE
jgi:DNA-binding response OmpR family regulator